MKWGVALIHRLLVLALILVAAVILVVTAGKRTIDDDVRQDSVNLHWPSKNVYAVPKTIVSDRLRLVFAVGIEGTGHHMLQQTFRDVFEHSNLPFLDACPVTQALYPGLVPSLSESPLAYAQAHAKLFQEMNEMAESGKEVERYPGTIVPLQFDVLGTCAKTGMLSYPKDRGPDKALQYVDLPLVVRAAEAAGVDLRLIYLSRSAVDVVASTTKHRKFDLGYPGAEYNPPAKNFVRYMQILLTHATLLQAMLQEVDPRFVVCQRYDSMLSDEQVTRVAEFVSPNPEVAGIFAASLKGVVNPISANEGGNEKGPVYEGEGVIIMRLQEKFDALDAKFCPPSQH